MALARNNIKDNVGRVASRARGENDAAVGLNGDILEGKGGEWNVGERVADFVDDDPEEVAGTVAKLRGVVHEQGKSRVARLSRA